MYLMLKMQNMNENSNEKYFEFFQMFYGTLAEIMSLKSLK